MKYIATRNHKKKSHDVLSKLQSCVGPHAAHGSQVDTSDWSFFVLEDTLTIHPIILPSSEYVVHIILFYTYQGVHSLNWGEGICPVYCPILRTS